MSVEQELIKVIRAAIDDEVNDRVKSAVRELLTICSVSSDELTGKFEWSNEFFDKLWDEHRARPGACLWLLCVLIAAMRRGDIRLEQWINFAKQGEDEIEIDPSTAEFLELDRHWLEFDENPAGGVDPYADLPDSFGKTEKHERPHFMLHSRLVGTSTVNIKRRE